MKELTVKGVFRNGLISVFFQGFPVLTALIFVPLNIKYIGDALWGLYSLTITILFLFMYFNIGINPSVNKKLSALFGVNSEKSNIQELLSNGFYFNLVSALVIGGGMILLSPLIVDLSVGDSEYNNEAVSLFRLSGIVGIFSLLISFFRNVYEAKQNFILVSSLRAILSSTILIAPSFGYLIGLNIVQSFYLVLIVYALAFIFYFWIYFKDFGFPNIEYINKDVFKSLLY
ncbi:hypothetical protein, partial [Zhouia amylolytica]|uniref:hypothetical protein n=1 Tax=Zhouia amylolytica TaxID=376730 RepID=UPI0020CF89E0